MNNKLIPAFIVFLLILPAVLAQVKVQVGEPYTNIEDLSEIEFTAHKDYYELCSLDKTIIPVLIKNKNNFSDMFNFQVNQEYASLSVKSAVIKSGKSALLPLTISPPAGLEENTTLILDITTEKEGLKRSVIIKTNIKKCYLFDLKIEQDNEEVCGCDKKIYNITLENNGEYTDTFTLILDTPEWVNSALTNKTIKLTGGQKREIKLVANISCEEKGIFTVSAKAISEKSKITLEDELELNVLSQNECYNTIIIANNLDIDYFGKNIPITIKNKGIKDADYSLAIEGIDWYTLSQANFSLKQNREKTINLALYPGENVAEGDYNIDIRAKTGNQEFTKSIAVKLKKKGIILGKVKFYVNYFKYYIWAGIVLLVIVLLLAMQAKKRIKKKGRKKKAEKEVKKVEKKIEEKKADKKAKKIKIEGLLPFILYLIFLGLLALLVYSTFKYKPYYEKALNFISVLFADYIVPYASYLRYAVAGVCALIVLLLVVDFFRKKPKKKKAEKRELKEEKPKEKIVEVQTKKKVKRKLRLFEYVYLIFVVLLFLAVIVYAVYRFSGKSIPVDKLGLKDFVANYFAYFIGGIVILVLLIGVINFVKNKEKKTKKVKEKKTAKKLKKKTKKLIKNLLIIIAGLIVLSGIIYSFIYYNLIDYTWGFFVVYYPYILMGIGILAILILILHFHNKNIQ